MDMYGKAMLTAYKLATYSPDPSTQNGAVLMDSITGRIRSQHMGVNTFPPGVVESKARLERPQKYMYIEHAERRCIFNAAVAGVDFRNMTMVAPWAACADCARAIISVGIQILVRHDEAMIRGSKNERWLESIKVADAMMEEAGVDVINWSGTFGRASLRVRMDGEWWTP